MVPPIQSKPELVQAAVACGFTETEIAERLGLSLDSLRDQFSDELRCSEFDANLCVLRSIYFLATERLHPVAAMFWAKVRGGWRQKPSPQAPPEDQLSSDFPRYEFRVHRNDDEPNHID